MESSTDIMDYLSASANFQMDVIDSNMTQPADLQSVAVDKATEDSVQACLADKTPVSLLRELCMKRGLTPKFDFIEHSGPVHERIFTFRVTVGESSAIGKGLSKKLAKQSAASLVIRQMVLNADSPAALPITSEYTSSTSISASGSNGNAIGKLQELTQKKYTAPPVYEFTDNGRQPHEREYTCNVTLFGVSETACSRTKKEAKRLAASQLLERLSTVTGQEFGANHSSAVPTNNVNPTRPSAYAQLRDGRSEPKSASASTKPAAVRQRFSGLESSHIQTLQQIADEHKFSVTFVDITEHTSTGQHQCFVQLSTLPVILCRGVGRTKAESRIVAALDALRAINYIMDKVEIV